MTRYALAPVGLLLSLAMGGCSSVQQQMAVADTCVTNAAVISTLADLAKAGKLNAAQVAAIGKDIAVVGPICTADTPSQAMTTAALQATQELSTVLADVNKESSK